MGVIHELFGPEWEEYLRHKRRNIWNRKGGIKGPEKEKYMDQKRRNIWTRKREIYGPE